VASVTDILNAIDETLNSLDLCACGCGQRLGPRSASPWYAGEACQARWMERGSRRASATERARLLLDVEPRVRPRPYWPAGPSVYDLMPDITEWLNANGIRAMDVPVGEVAQLHDGQITVWTFDRPRRIVSDAEGPARTLVTVPMVVAPPDVIQPWLRGQCRESLPFAAREPGRIICRTHYDPERIEVERADQFSEMTLEVYRDLATRHLLNVGGRNYVRFGTEGLGLGVVTYRVTPVPYADRMLMERVCCDLHGSNCEQGGEECCGWCTEAHHFEPDHGGMECSAPVFAVDVSRDGTSTVAVSDGTRYTVIDETHQINVEEFVTRLRAEDVTQSDEHFRRFYLNTPVRGEPDVPPVDAALQAPYHDVAACEVCRLWRESERPDLDHSSHSMQWVDGCPECPSAQDRPQRRTAAVTDLDRSTEVDAPRHVDTRGAGRFHTEQSSAGEWYEVPCDCPTEEPRRPWWRFW
jgi:hypothetical protein